MLSETAEFDSKPELEIFADDVVCGHGSTSGQIDEDLLFYLESRGIPEAEARALLIRPLSARRSSASSDEGLRAALSAASAEWLGVRTDERAADDRDTRRQKISTPSRRRTTSRAIRADFPILSREVNGKPLVYLDNGASAQKPEVVLDTIERAYGEEYANVHRGLHYLSNLSTANFEKARETVRRFLNARSDEEIIFTRNATEAINLVA